MSLENFDASALTTIVLAVFAVLGFLKKMVNIFFTVIALGVGGLAGIWGYNNGFSIASKAVETPEPWMSNVVAGIAFLGAFTIVRGILKFLTGQGAEGTQTRSLGFGLPGGILGILMGGGLSYGLLSGVRYGGTLSELDHLKDYVNGKIEKNADSPLLAKVKDWVDNSKIGQLHQKIDLFNSPEEAQLAKIAIVKEGQDPAAKAIIILDEDIPFALPVDDNMEQVIETGDFATLLKKAKELGVDVDAEKLLRMNIEKALGIQK